MQQLSANADEMPDDDGPLTTHCILQILIKATYLEKVTHKIKEMFKSSPLFNYEHAPLMSSIPVLALLNKKESIQRSSHTLNTVSTWTVDWQQGFERVYVSGDGNYSMQLCELAFKSTECNDWLHRLRIHEGAPHHQVHQDLHKIVAEKSTIPTFF